MTFTQSRDPFPPSFGIGFRPTMDERQLLDDWTFWSGICNIDRQVLSFLDTTLMMIGLMLTKHDFKIRTEWLEPLVDSIYQKWVPFWPWDELPSDNEDHHEAATWIIDSKSVLVNNGGFSAPALMKEWLEHRLNRTTYENIKLLATIVSHLVHETSPLLENSAKIVLASCDKITRANFRTNLENTSNLDPLLQPRDRSPDNWMATIFNITREEVSPESGVLTPVDLNMVKNEEFVTSVASTLHHFIKQDLERQAKEEVLIRRMQNAESSVGKRAQRHAEETIVVDFISRLKPLSEILSEWKATSSTWPKFR